MAILAGPPPDRVYDYPIYRGGRIYHTQCTCKHTRFGRIELLVGKWVFVCMGCGSLWFNGKNEYYRVGSRS